MPAQASSLEVDASASAGIDGKERSFSLPELPHRLPVLECKRPNYAAALADGRLKGPHPSEATAETRRPATVLRLQPAARADKKKSGPSPRLDTLTAPSPAAASSTPPLRPRPPLECDYDQSRTELYKLIEQSKWTVLLKRLETDDGGGGDACHDEGGASPGTCTGTGGPERSLHQQAAVWVVRKEGNGRLRWRLLPLHAAIIFQAPTAVTEALLEAFPAAAAQKDDQGMVPLHLAMRNFGAKNVTAASLWLVVEELLTAFPAAVFSRDRKGRTPLQGGLLATNSEPKNKSALTVLQLYSNILTAGEKNSLEQRQQAATDVQLAAMQQQHASTLEELRGAFLKEQASAKEVHDNGQKELQRQLDESLQRERQLKSELEEARRQLQAGEACRSISIDVDGPTEVPSNDREQERVNDLVRVLQQQNRQLFDELRQILSAQYTRSARWRLLATQEEEQVQEQKERIARLLHLRRAHNPSANDAPLDGRGTACARDESIGAAVHCGGGGPSPVGSSRGGASPAADKTRKQKGEPFGSGTASVAFDDEHKNDGAMQLPSGTPSRGQLQRRRSLADEILKDLDTLDGYSSGDARTNATLPMGP